MPQTSLKTRAKVIKLKSQNFTICQISKITKVHKATVSRIIIRYEQRGHVENTKSAGRPREVTGRVERVVTLVSKKHPFLNSTQLRNFTKVDLSSSTIRRILVKYGLRSRICPKKPQISDKNREKRKQWAEQMLMEKTQDFWNSIIFRTKQ